MRVLVVDDEPLARRRLERLLERIDGVEVVGVAGDGKEAARLVRKLDPDVVLLDIEMPGLDGMSLARRTRDLPPVIFITAHEEFALEAFEVEAADYLLKPVEPERLRQALERARSRSLHDLAERFDRLAYALTGSGRFPKVVARRDSTQFVFDAREIVRFRAGEKYVGFEVEGRRYLTEESLRQLEERLGDWGFFRVHRGELVQTDRIRAVEIEPGGGVVAHLDNGQRVPVSRRRVASLRRRLGLRDS